MYTLRDGKFVCSHGRQLELARGACNATVLNFEDLEQYYNCSLKNNFTRVTLEEVFTLPFEKIFLDIKDTFYNTHPSFYLTVVRNLIEAIQADGMEDKVILMLYRVNEDIHQLLHSNNILAGIKGYPKSAEEALQIIRHASRYKTIEMACFAAEAVTPLLIKESAQYGIYHIPYYWSSVADKDLSWLPRAGAAGLIGNFDDEWQHKWQYLKDAWQVLNCHFILLCCIFTSTHF